MIDIERIKSLDCRQIVESHWGKPKAKGSNYLMYPCHFHQEHKGASFVVYPDGWKCHGKCGTGGDAISFIERAKGLTFKEAAAYLGAQQYEPVQIQRREASSEPPPREWQEAAHKVVIRARDTLWSREGARAREYLRGRGLLGATILHARLGYIPGHGWNKLEGLKVPSGILIPWYCGGALWAINVRRAAGQPKYMQVSGGHIRGALYGADDVTEGAPMLFTEGEFDRLIAYQCAPSVSCLSLGGAGNHLHPRWYPQLLGASRIMALMDNDQAGDQAASALGGLSQRITRVRPPVGKDLTEFYCSFESFALDRVGEWIEGVIA